MADEEKTIMGPGFPTPGALSAQQMKSITANVAAQRKSIQALRAQLAAYDQQLAALERFLGPLAEWSGRWAELEKLMLNPGPPPKPDA
jgi:hypothetical protein